MCGIHLFCFTGLMVVVKADGNPTLCKTDEVGELCLSAPYSGTGYWGLQGVSNAAFKVTRKFHVVRFKMVTGYYSYTVKTHCILGH